MGKKIHLTRVYTGFDLINVPVGVYDINDTILKGRGPYLVKNRIAFPVDSPEIVGLSAAGSVNDFEEDFEDEDDFDEDPAPAPVRPAAKRKR